MDSELVTAEDQKSSKIGGVVEEKIRKKQATTLTDKSLKLQTANIPNDQFQMLIWF